MFNDFPKFCVTWLEFLADQNAQQGIYNIAIKKPIDFHGLRVERKQLVNEVIRFVQYACLH